MIILLLVAPQLIVTVFMQNLGDSYHYSPKKSHSLIPEIRIVTTIKMAIFIPKMIKICSNSNQILFDDSPPTMFMSYSAIQSEYYNGVFSTSFPSSRLTFVFFAENDGCWDCLMLPISDPNDLLLLHGYLQIKFQLCRSESFPSK